MDCRHCVENPADDLTSLRLHIEKHIKKSKNDVILFQEQGSVHWVKTSKKCLDKWEGWRDAINYLIETASAGKA